MFVRVLDDAKRTDLKHASEALRALGHEVESLDSPQDFRVASRRAPDLQVVDHKIKKLERTKGPRNGTELVAVSAAERGAVETVLLTNFEPDCKKRVASLDPRLPATVVQKPPTGGAIDEWIMTLAPAIEEIKGRKVNHRGERLGINASEVQQRLFHSSLKEVRSLGLRERDRAESDALLELHPKMSGIWRSCESDWVLLCRVEGEIIVLDRGVDETLLSDDDVIDREEDYDSPCMVVGRPTLVEEGNTLAPIICTPSGGKDWKRYPFVRIRVGDQDRDYHLDTGSGESFISRELLQEQKIELPKKVSKRTVVTDLGGYESVEKKLPVRVPIHIRGPVDSPRLEFDVQAVSNWADARLLNPPCDGQKCPDSEGVQCGRRHGLMGRDLLYAFSDGVWTFDPASSWTYPRPPDANPKP